MGLIDFIKGELIEIVEWTDDSRHTLAHRFPDADKAIKVDRVWCAVDIGRQIVNPSHSENLVHGGFIEGMSHLMSWAITIQESSSR